MLKRSIMMAMLGLSTGSVLAQAESSSLQEVVVSGSRAETKLSETPVSIGSVSQETWNADKTKSVGEIINRIPGVFWNDLGNEQHSMGIRQPISTNAVYQYLEDGIPIRPLGVFNHNALNETNMNGSGGVEVVKGAASSLYGSNAVGGAVNFVTLEPSRTPTGYLGLRELFDFGAITHAHRLSGPARGRHSGLFKVGLGCQQHMGRLGPALFALQLLP